MKPACRPNFKEFVCTLCRRRNAEIEE